ncbi:hypothetical protein RhiirB3_504468, partial [Rhizophagus irregularis]
MLYLFVTAYENGISLVKSAVVGIKESGNFEDLLKEALSNELFLEDKLVKVDLQCNDSSAWHPVLNGLTENIEACFQLKAQHVHFTISHSISIPNELSNEGSSAFNFMMTQQRLKKLPPLYNSQFRNDLLYNDFLKILQERKLGWLNDNHLTIGHSFIRRVTDLVWYLDPHLGKLEKRGLKLPKIIAKLPVYASESHYNLYHDTTKHKKIEISREKLESFVKALILSIQQPWTRLLHWEEVIKDIDDLIKIAQEYANYLQGVNNRMRTIHTSLVPVRNGRDDITVEDIEAVDLYPSQYEFLAQLLRESNDYDLLNIDHLLPPKPQNIYLFFQNICADVSFTLYRYYHGNYLGTLNFVWKIPSLDKCDKTKEAKNISAAYDQIPIYCTRQMRKNVINKYSLIVKASRSILQVLYQDLTGDVSTPDNEINKKTHERIKLMLDTQDPDIIIDLRKIINEKGTKFDVFWNEMQDYFNEVTPAVHDRRHTSTLYMPIAISVKDLVQIIIERLENKYGTIPNDIEIPSTEWVRLQFWPKTEFSENQYTGRFQIRYMIQARQIRKSHIDSHYCSALWRYLREFAIKFKEYTTLICADDKHKVPIGESVATSTGVRNKSALTTIDGILNSCDHDFTKLSLTPSASLFVDIPNSISDSFYQGQVYIAYKDTIFQPSSAIRHATEFYNNYSIQYQDNINKPKILLLYTDGGPDHRCTYGSVQISLIALFLKGNFDFLAAVRTAPYHSWANPAERIMSILNLALQGVALKREDMSGLSEQAFEKLKTLSEIREGANSNSHLKEELIKSIKITQEFLENRTSRLSLHDLKFKIASPAIETEIDSLFESILTAESQLTINDTTLVELRKFHKLKEFIDTHCQIRQYSFQIKKCNNSECTICLPVELPIEVFDELHFLPDPEPSI